MIHQYAQYISCAQRGAAAQQALLASRSYETPTKGRKKRFVSDVQRMRHAAQNNTVCRGLDAAFVRARAPRPLMAATESAHLWQSTAVYAGCVVALTARCVIDVVACLVGVMFGAGHAFAALPAWRGAVESTVPHAEVVQSLQTVLNRYDADHSEHKKYVCPDAGPLSMCDLFSRDVVRGADMTLQQNGVTLTHWDKTPLPLTQYSLDLETLCQGDKLWGQHVSRALSQTVGNSIAIMVHENQVHTVAGSPVFAWSTTAQHTAFVANRQSDDAVSVRASFKNELGYLLLGPDVRQQPCTGWLNIDLTLTLPRPKSPDALPVMFVEDFAISSDLAAA